MKSPIYLLQVRFFGFFKFMEKTFRYGDIAVFFFDGKFVRKDLKRAEVFGFSFFEEEFDFFKFSDFFFKFLTAFADF